MGKENRILDDIKQEVGDVFGILNCIKIIGDLDEFKNWLRREYKIENFEDLFEGYKFFLESAIRTFLNTLIYNFSLNINEDFVFYRARFEGVELNKIPNTCKKTILIKNINEKLKLMKKAKNYEELKSAIIKFNNVLDIFKIIYDYNVAVNPELSISKDSALKYLTMFYTFIFLNDTSRFIPHGYWVSVLNNKIQPEQHKKNFKGYKYSLQFVWASLLGKKYYLTSIVNLHKSRGWSVKDGFDFVSSSLLGKKFYLYLTSVKDDFDLKNHKSEKIIQRGDLDNYFGKIQREIIEPIEKELKINLGFTKILYLKKKVSKELFKELLKSQREPQLNEKEKLDFNLLWYQIEFLDSSRSHIFNGVPAFISLLIGTAEIKSRFSENEKAYICKFIHPDQSVNGNDFSYGVLIEALGGTGISDYSGWILFFDCCGDYSGFAGSEHAKAEMFIEEYKKRGMIEVREMTINKNKLKDYIADKITSGKREEILQILEKETKIRRERNVVSDARGLVLELLTYYTLSKKVYDLVEWNIKINQDQLDIILETKNDFTLIECITNPNNENIDSEIQKIIEKLNRYDTNKSKKCAFWFWIRPHQKIIDKLGSQKIIDKLGSKIEHAVFSELIETDPALRHKKKDKLNSIFKIRDKKNSFILSEQID